MKRFSNLTCSLLLAAFVTLGLSACAEGEGDLGADTTGVGTDTAMTGQQDGMGQGGVGQDGMGQGGMEGGSVTAQNTISLLRQGVRSIPVNQAVQNINGWQQQLQQQSGNQALSQINDDLDQLKSELQAGEIDGQAVGELMTQLGNQTSQAAQNASGQSVQQLQQLGQALTQAGNQLTGGQGGGGSM